VDDLDERVEAGSDVLQAGRVAPVPLGREVEHEPARPQHAAVEGPDLTDADVSPGAGCAVGAKIRRVSISAQSTMASNSRRSSVKSVVAVAALPSVPTQERDASTTAPPTWPPGPTGMRRRRRASLMAGSPTSVRVRPSRAVMSQLTEPPSQIPRTLSMWVKWYTKRFCTGRVDTAVILPILPFAGSFPGAVVGAAAGRAV
jgi:hypothetical protein